LLVTEKQIFYDCNQAEAHSLFTNIAPPKILYGGDVLGETFLDNFEMCIGNRGCEEIGLNAYRQGCGVGVGVGGVESESEGILGGVGVSKNVPTPNPT
jgi:hypothetical protein